MKLSIALAAIGCLLLILLDWRRDFFLDLFRILCLAFLAIQVLAIGGSRPEWPELRIGNRIRITPFSQAIAILVVIWGGVGLFLLLD